MLGTPTQPPAHTHCDWRTNMCLIWSALERSCDPVSPLREIHSLDSCHGAVRLNAHLNAVAVGPPHEWENKKNTNGKMPGTAAHYCWVTLGDPEPLAPCYICNVSGGGNPTNFTVPGLTECDACQPAPSPLSDPLF